MPTCVPLVLASPGAWADGKSSWVHQWCPGCPLQPRPRAVHQLAISPPCTFEGGIDITMHQGKRSPCPGNDVPASPGSSSLSLKMQASPSRSHQGDVHPATSCPCLSSAKDRLRVTSHCNKRRLAHCRTPTSSTNSHGKGAITPAAQRLPHSSPAAVQHDTHVPGAA